MADASFWTGATVVAAVGAGTGVVAGPALSAFGIDVTSIGAGLLGCVVVQVFSQGERVSPLRVAATALGSVLVASFGAPYIAPAFLVEGVKPEHAHAVASAMLGGSAKPTYLLVRSRFEAWLASRLPQPPGDTKGPTDA